MIECSYTLEDLKKAEEELKSWHKKFGDYEGNNPNKYGSQIANAASRVRCIEEALKNAGKMPMENWEKLRMELDSKFPNAPSKSIVEHEGRRYQIKYYPIRTSRSRRTVIEWGHNWIPLEENKAQP